MFGSDVLEVGIGMSLLFLMMSLIATAVREGIEALLKGRAKDLEKGIREMLSDTKAGNYDGLVGQIYKHPLINSLYRGTLGPKGNSDLPPYIPSKVFVAALLDTAVNAKITTDAAGQTKAATAPAGTAPKPITLDSLKACAKDLPEQIRQPVLLAINDAQGNIDTVKTNLEAWFDATMDRASGWYRRRTQIILFAIGIAAAVVLNVDSLTIAQRLTSDKALRQGIIETAKKSSGTSVADSAKDLSKAFGNIGLPVGWTQPDNDKMIYPAAQMCTDKGCNYSAGNVFQTLIGWLVTAFAIMLGAPFWFDVLNRFMVIRSTVKPNEKSQPEASKDSAPASLTLLTAPAVAPAAKP